MSQPVQHVKHPRACFSYFLCVQAHANPPKDLLNFMIGGQSGHLGPQQQLPASGTSQQDNCQ